MKGKLNKLAVVLSITAMLMALPAAVADSGSAEVSATVSNVQPTVGVATVTTDTGDGVDPNIGQANATVDAEATATDNNGGGDVTAARCIVRNPGDEIFAVVSGTVHQDTVSGATVTVSCQFQLRYYDATGDWDVTFQVQDEDLVWSSEGLADTFAYNPVQYIDLNATSVGWDNLVPGETGRQSEDWINVTNFGNSAIVLHIKGEDLDVGENVIPIENVEINDLANSTNPRQAYTESYADFDDANADIEVYDGGSARDWEDFAHYIDVPSVIADGVYDGFIYICAGTCS